MNFRRESLPKNSLRKHSNIKWITLIKIHLNIFSHIIGKDTLIFFKKKSVFYSTLLEMELINKLNINNKM